MTSPHLTILAIRNSSQGEDCIVFDSFDLPIQALRRVFSLDIGRMNLDREHFARVEPVCRPSVEYVIFNCAAE